MIIGAAVALPSLAGDIKAAQTLKAKRLSLAAPGMLTGGVPLSVNAKGLNAPLDGSGSAQVTKESPKKENRKSLSGPLSSSQSAICKEGSKCCWSQHEAHAHTGLHA
jgi:hypothetical protein